MVSGPDMTLSDFKRSHDALACYLQADTPELDSSKPLDLDMAHTCRQHFYALPLGNLRLLKVVVYLPTHMKIEAIEATQAAVVKAAKSWYGCFTQGIKSHNTSTATVLVLDIQIAGSLDTNHSRLPHDSVDSNENGHAQKVSWPHSFGAGYVRQEWVSDFDDTQMLQIFSWQDWQSIIAMLQTPGDIWRFLRYHLAKLQQSLKTGVPQFDTEEALIKQFLYETDLLSQAITVDNALIRYGVQDQPNPALVTMSLAQKHKNATTQLYHEHRQQAAILWSQLSTQMIDLAANKSMQTKTEDSEIRSCQWQQQLLDESLFSRHELVRTLYLYPKQTKAMKESGYVVHQHSYESLGRHYVLIFYGTAVDGQQSKALIQPNLAKIAHDVATRLPIAELHHVVILGVDFIDEAQAQFIDIDLWIQPVMPMTQRERQLTKQVQQLQQQNAATANAPAKDAHKIRSGAISAGQTKPLAQVRLNLSIPARKSNKP